MDPWGQRREDWRFADLSANICVAMGVKKLNGTRFKTEDFLLQFDIDKEPPKPQTPEEIEKRFREIFRANNEIYRIREERQRRLEKKGIRGT